MKSFAFIIIWIVAPVKSHIFNKNSHHSVGVSVLIEVGKSVHEPFLIGGVKHKSRSSRSRSGYFRGQRLLMKSSIRISFLIISFSLFKVNKIFIDFNVTKCLNMSKSFKERKLMKDDEWKKLLEIVNSFDKWYPLHGVIEYSPEITGAAARKGGILFVEIQKIAPGQLELILHIKDKDRDENLTRRVTPSYLPDAKSDLFARLEQIMEALRQECDREQSVKEKDIISEALEIARNQK